MLNSSEHTRIIWQNLRNRNVFLACSGGVDSMVLLHLLRALKVNLTVIHVNYQLRGEASDQDANLVEKICQENNIPFEIRTVDLKKTLENGGNLQEEARKVRYSWFDDILAEDTNNRITLAHHQDDQVETFLMNLSRKSGVIGLACMKAEHNGIVRPLLDFSKTEILVYAKKHAIEWREDRSNSSNNYARNRLRNEFIPYVKSEIPHFDTSVLTLVKAFQQKQTELEQKVEPIIQTIVDTCALPISTFEALTEYQKVELLRQLDIPASYVCRLHELNERGKQVEFNNAAFQSAVRDEDQFTFLKEKESSFKLVIEEVDALPKDFDKQHVFFDASKIQGELQLRKWAIGDRISPVGMKGSQLVSDIIKDAKITADAKRNQLVVHDDSSVHWCVGLKIGRKAIANSDSTRMLRCSVISSKAEE